MKTRKRVYAYLVEFSDASFVAQFGESAWVYHLAHNLWEVSNPETGSYFQFEGSPLRYSFCKNVGVAYWPDSDEV